MMKDNGVKFSTFSHQFPLFSHSPSFSPCYSSFTTFLPSWCYQTWDHQINFYNFSNLKSITIAKISNFKPKSSDTESISVNFKRQNRVWVEIYLFTILCQLSKILFRFIVNTWFLNNYKTGVCEYWYGSADTEQKQMILQTMKQVSAYFSA